MSNEMSVFVSLGCITVEHDENFLVCGMVVARTQYNVKHYGKHEILFMGMCLLNLKLTPDWVGQ